MDLLIYVLADSPNILNNLENYFCRLLNVSQGNEFRQTKIHIAKPLVPDPSPFEPEVAYFILRCCQYLRSANVDGRVTGLENI
jgi:hypothetical protein